MTTQLSHTPFQDESKPDHAPGQAVRTIDIKVSGQPLDPHHMGHIIKPGELVDIVEITPLSRNEMILYNQLLGHGWDRIAENDRVHSIRKAVLRGTHDSNDRLDNAFDNLMGAWAKIRYKDRAGKSKIARVHLIGPNTEEEEQDGFFYYKFPEELLAIISRSEVWAKLKSHIMYSLRSKYSIRLYEMIEKRIGLRMQHEYFSVEEFRALMGVPNGKLPRYGEFNKHCLKTALSEVNQLTDYHVQIAAIKSGRSVEKIMLSWMKKDAEASRVAHDERERHHIGRAARRQGRVDVIKFEE